MSKNLVRILQGTDLVALEEDLAILLAKDFVILSHDVLYVPGEAGILEGGLTHIFVLTYTED